MKNEEPLIRKREHLRIESRLLKIHNAIRGDKCPSLKKLAEITGRHERTIRRDMDILRDRFDAPLDYDHSKKGYFYRDPFWDFDFKFTEGELLAFFFAEDVLKNIGQTTIANQLRTSLAKLASRLPEQVSFTTSSLTELMSFQDMPHIEIEPQLLTTLTKAANDQRTIKILYHTQQSNEQKWRKVNVLVLNNFAGDWYAIAFDHLRGEVRDFNVGRIKRLEETSDFFDPPANWDKEEYLKRGFSMTRGGRKTKVSLLFDAHQARWMRERKTSFPNEAREDLPDGSLRLSFRAERNGLEAVARFCLTYAGNCVAEEPKELRRIVRERLEKALAQH